MKRTIVTVAACALIAACGGSEQTAQTTPPANAPAPQIPDIDQGAIMEHVKVLASDEYEGRAPGTNGEALTVQYLIEQSKAIGLQPGNPDGTYVQKVPLVGITGSEAEPFTVVKGSQKRTFKYSDEVVAFTERVTGTASIDNSDLVFVGYGVSAPEYNWDDFKGMDLKGKTIVVLVNDPQVPDASDPSKHDPKRFNGQ